MVQWLRVYLPMKGTWVRSLVQEDPTRAGQLDTCATTTERTYAGHREPVLRQGSHCNDESKHQQGRVTLSLQLEKVQAQQGRPSTNINKSFF